MKNKKVLIFFLIGLVGVMLLDVFMRTKSKMNFEKFVLDKTGIKLNECIIVSDKNDRNKLNGSGTTLAEFDCSDGKIEIDTKSMKSLPLTGDLNGVVYGSLNNDGVSYHLAQDVGLPEIKTGYYYFLDDYTVKYKDAKDENSEDMIIAKERKGMNFTLLMYDTETKHFYYYEIDS